MSKRFRGVAATTATTAALLQPSPERLARARATLQSVCGRRDAKADHVASAFASALHERALPSLWWAVGEFDAANGGDGAFATAVLPTIVSAAEEAAAATAALALDQPEARFTRQQLHALMSAAFLCAYDDHARTGANLPTFSFIEMFAAPLRQRGAAERGSVEAEKLLMHFDYFAECARRRAAWAAAECDASVPPADDVGLVVLRHKAAAAAARLEGDAALRAQPLLPVVMHPLRASIDDAHDALRIDFANCVIGGASLSFGCVQEEIMFSIIPELNVARLFHTPMADDEAIVLLRAEQFSTLEPGTYAFTMRHGGANPVPPAARRSDGAIVAIDALDFRGQLPAQQYHPQLVRRELDKFLAGVTADTAAHVPPEMTAAVATGAWGAGAFRGDVYLKLLIQWLGCSVAGKTMHFYPFDRDDVAEHGPALVARLRERGMTCGDLHTFLTTGLGRFSPRSNVWDCLLAWVDAKQSSQ